MKNTSSNLLEKIWNNRYQKQEKVVVKLVKHAENTTHILGKPEESNSQDPLLLNETYVEREV